MADRTTVVKVDDLDPSIETDVRTVAFSYDGSHYEIDLGGANRAALAAALAPYVAAARATRGPAARGRRAQVRAEAAAVRSWAAARGIDLSSRGRIPSEVRARYEADRRG